MTIQLERKDILDILTVLLVPYNRVEERLQRLLYQLSRTEQHRVRTSDAVKVPELEPPDPGYNENNQK